MIHPVAVLLVAVALVLVAAKAHGRQVRLERERAGHREVTFGGANPPFVEALWARDRRRFWGAFPLLALASWGALHLVGAAPWRGGPWTAFLVQGLAWPFAGAFFVAGLWSLAASRLGGAGSAGWWGGALALLALDAALIMT